MTTEEKVKRAEELQTQINDLKWFIKSMDYHDYKEYCFIKKKVEYSFLYKFIMSKSSTHITIPEVLSQKIELDAAQLLEALQNELDELFN